jgi:hypothetical protein
MQVAAEKPMTARVTAAKLRDSATVDGPACHCAHPLRVERADAMAAALE